MGNLTAPVFGLIKAIDGLFAKKFRYFLERRFLLASQKQGGVAVVHNGIGSILVDGLWLIIC